MQWLIILAVGGLAIAGMHLALTRRRKVAHSSEGVALLSPPRRSIPEIAPQPAMDARIARIISEIPKRRVRQHFAP